MWLEVESHQRKLCRAVDFRGTAAFAGVAPGVRFDAFGCVTTSKAEAHAVGVQFLQQGRAGLELLGTAFRGVCPEEGPRKRPGCQKLITTTNRK